MEKIWVKLYISFNDIVYIIMLFSVFFLTRFYARMKRLVSYIFF